MHSDKRFPTWRQFPAATWLFLAAISGWCVIFWPLITGQKPPIIDAAPYYGHVQFLLDNLKQGIYPLWVPGLSHGAPSELILRRIGEFNPLYALTLLLNVCGLPALAAYTVSLSAYFLFGCWGFYLLAGRILKNFPAAFCAFALYLFSSAGTQLFVTFVNLVTIPLIWFFYFLVSWNQDYKRHQFLGLSLSLLIIFTTYLPFHSLTIIAVFGLLYLLFYGRCLPRLLREQSRFSRKNLLLCALCGVMVFASLGPGYLFWKSGKEKSIELAGRHAKFQSDNSVAIQTQSAEQGVLLPSICYYLFGRSTEIEPNMLFMFVPYLAVLLLPLSLVLRPRRLFLLLITWFWIIFLIGQNDGTPIYPFLYKHIPGFAYFRNAFFYAWFLLLPLFILYAALIFKYINRCLRLTRHPVFWLAGLLLTHGGLLYLLFSRHHDIPASYAAVIVSFLCGAALCLKIARPDPKITGAAILFIVWLQAAGVYALYNKNFENSRSYKSYTTPVRDFSFAEKKPAITGPDIRRNIPYYSTGWILFLYQNLRSSDAFNHYLSKRLLLVDKLIPLSETSAGLTCVEDSWQKNLNQAFIPADDPGPYSSWDFHPGGQADIILEGDPRLTLRSYNANAISFQTRLTIPRFLVYNDPYHPDWTASINNRPARIIRTNIAFKGLWLPAGASLVTMRFGNPWRYAIGYFIFFAAYGSFLLILYWAWRDRFFSSAQRGLNTRETQCEN
ncbi:MAG: hypothetical protein HQL23_07965 [Candidatus Omnitrophica bacterium]|nr:hypothetical protein [Candidatus Omnitrophota bacterium]